MDFALSEKIEVLVPNQIYRVRSPILAYQNPAPESEKDGSIVPIYLFTQYFIENKSKERRKELQSCLRQNFMNPLITRIYLMNEREYTLAEMGFAEEERTAVTAKIQQHILGRRLNFADPLDLFEKERVILLEETSASASGGCYIIMANADIYFAPNLQRLFFTQELMENRSALALLRMDVPADPNKDRPSLSPQSDCQDTWVFHSNHLPTKKALDEFRAVEFGKPGCDKKIAYSMFMDGYTVINDPITITTFHLHLSEVRNYSVADALPPPYMYVIPAQIPLEILLR